MASQESLNFVYAEQMKHHPQGYALYEPISTEVLKPGACGYFDRYGSWNVVAQLDDPESLQKHGFLDPSEELQADHDKRKVVWGPKCSVGVKGAKVDVEVGVSANGQGIPAEAKAVFKYSTSTGFGAILLTAPPMVKKAYLYESPFQQWVKQNVQQIDQLRGPEVRQYGLWIVTSTWSTSQCSINAWKQASKEVVVGFKARVFGEEFGPEGQWFEDEMDTDWTHYSGDDERRMVVFIGALRFRFSRMPWREAKLKEMDRAKSTILRSGEEQAEVIYFQSEENAEVGYEVDYEVLGCADDT
ncbi:hypothetical protein MMC30_003623 [Trapelia coarctata]|nr:hypothetical protein [Trapelia coarctata]